MNKSILMNENVLMNEDILMKENILVDIISTTVKIGKKYIQEVRFLLWIFVFNQNRSLT